MNIVNLNVGGLVYCTSRTTLQKYPFFSKVEDNEFIDRDGTYFYYILNAMRGSNLVPCDQHIADHIREEAFFYGLTAYAQKIKQNRS